MQAPVTGRWLVYNSPGTRVPSHGVQAYGQTYAIDLVYDPDDGRRPRFAWWPLARRPADFLGFGQPVLATADGAVVRVHDRERDHWSRTSPLGLLYLFTVELVRDLFGPSRVLGNHVILDVGNGVYEVFAHLRRRSIKVTVGQRITAGEQIAECGNSGNTTEPHLHFQLLDHPNPAIAAGLPFRLCATASPPSCQKTANTSSRPTRIDNQHSIAVSTEVSVPSPVAGQVSLIAIHCPTQKLAFSVIAALIVMVRDIRASAAFYRSLGFKVRRPERDVVGWESGAALV